MYSLGSLGNPGGLGEAGYVDMQIHKRDTAFCSLRKLPFCTANWLKSIRRLKISMPYRVPR